MACPMDAIRFRVRQALYSGSSAIAFRAFFNRLVDEGILSDEQLDQHHAEINSLYHEWQTGSQVQQCQKNQHMPLSPKPLPPLGIPPLIVTSSPPSGDVWTDRSTEELKTAILSIHTSVGHSYHF